MRMRSKSATESQLSRAPAPLCLLCVLAVAGCSSAAQDDSLGDGGALTGAAGDGAEFDEPPGDDGRGDDDGASSGGDSGAPPDPGQSDDGAGDDGAPEMKAGCPETLPEGWFFCEDFESVVDPIERFFEYADADGRFTLVEGMGASGIRSMASTYAEGQEGAGLLIVSFGESPLDHATRPAYAPSENFDEIYWRFRVRMEAGWPDVGPGRLSRAMSFAAEDWSEAFVAHVASAGDATTLEVTPQTCVAAGNVTCQGYDDAAGLESIGGLVGQTELFSEAASGQWHCVEVHMRLNTPGESDGILEFWVDDVFEASTDALDWRGDWEAYGINAVAIENLWPGGAPGPLRRWIDDIVVSTKPIGCG